MTTTPTGIPIIDCAKCGGVHPESRSHCDNCGNPTAFIRLGWCIPCRDKAGIP